MSASPREPGQHVPAWLSAGLYPSAFPYRTAQVTLLTTVSASSAAKLFQTAVNGPALPLRVIAKAKRPQARRAKRRSLRSKLRRIDRPGSSSRLYLDRSGRPCDVLSFDAGEVTQPQNTKAITWLRISD